MNRSTLEKHVMNDTLILGVGQAHELELAFRRHDYTNALIKELSKGDMLARVKEVLLGRAVFTIMNRVIDLDVAPLDPKGLSVEEHQKGGQFEWNATKVKLHLSENQQGGRVIQGCKLRKELEKEPVFNASLLDYLIKPENQHLIPEDWKKDKAGAARRIYFWGTIYRNPRNGYLFVCYIEWRRGKWNWDYHPLDRDLSSQDPAAVFCE